MGRVALIQLKSRSSKLVRWEQMFWGKFQFVEAGLFSILFSVFILISPIKGSRDEFYREFSGLQNRDSGHLGEQIDNSNNLSPNISNGDWNQILDWSHQIQLESE